MTRAAAQESSASFSLVPPGLAKSLAGKAHTPEGEHVLQAADKVLGNTPHALSRIHTEGTLPHQGIRDQSEVAVADFHVVRDLALAYRLTGNAKYLTALEPYLVAWASVYKVSGDPIDETNFMDLFIGYDLVRSEVKPATSTAMTGLLRQFTEVYSKSVLAKKNDMGNFQSHRIKLFTLSAFGLGDTALIEQAHAAFNQHLSLNIRPDGSVWDFYHRDAIHYVTYDLEPLTAACLAAKQHGQDWFHDAEPNSVAHGIDWLKPYVTGQQTHIEFVHSPVKFDKARANAGLSDYAPHPWEPSAGLGLLTLAGAMEANRQDLCRQVATSAQKQPIDWVVLLFW